MMRATLATVILLLSVNAMAADQVEEKNKRIVSLIYTEIFGKWRIAENEHIYSDLYVGHAGNQYFTRAQDRAATEGWRTFSPEGTMTIDKIIAEGDMVAVLWTGSGVNTGEGNGMPATGKPFRVSGMTMFRLADGKIVEEWSVFDNFALLAQLDLLPKAAP